LLNAAEVKQSEVVFGRPAATPPASKNNQELVMRTTGLIAAALLALAGASTFANADDDRPGRADIEKLKPWRPPKLLHLWPPQSAPLELI